MHHPNIQSFPGILRQPKRQKWKAWAWKSTSSERRYEIRPTHRVLSSMSNIRRRPDIPSSRVFHSCLCFLFPCSCVDLFLGCYYRGQRHGLGIYRYKNGNGARYGGDWVFGQKQGWGTMYFGDGSMYTGNNFTPISWVIKGSSIEYRGRRFDSVLQGTFVTKLRVLKTSAL
jgi:hypothetical protein